MKRQGFTLLELTFVIGIIAMLIAAMMPLFIRSREAAHRETCANNLKQFANALHMYAQDNSGRFPARHNDYLSLYACCRNHDTLFCPSDDLATKWRDDVAGQGEGAICPYSSYVYRGGLTLEDEPTTMLMNDIRPRHLGEGNALYLDGSVRTLRPEGYRPVVKPPVLHLGMKWPRIPEPPETYGPVVPPAPEAPVPEVYGPPTDPNQVPSPSAVPYSGPGPPAPPAPAPPPEENRP